VTLPCTDQCKKNDDTAIRRNPTSGGTEGATRHWMSQFSAPTALVIADPQFSFGVTSSKEKKDVRRMQPQSRLTEDPALII
jgi:hypothetical protein